jgi:hypothetical protein
MQETVGTLNLKIAQLEQKLQLLQKQRLLSRPYPTHLAHLILQDFQTRSQLHRLLEYRARKQVLISRKLLTNSN